MRASHLSLDQVVSLRANMFEEIQDADCAFVFDLLQHAVNDNVRSCAANPCTEEQSAQQYEHTPRGPFLLSQHI